MPGLRSLPSLFALILFFAFLAVSLPPALGRSLESIRLARSRRGESVLDQRVRFWGPAYTFAIEEIRRVIPRGASYAIAETEPSPEGAPLWVRFDLAPRRAVFLGRVDRVKSARRVRNRIPRSALWVVVAHDKRPPELLERARFLRLLERRR